MLVRTAVVEEIRAGEETLAVEGMRKMVGTKNAKELIPSVLLNARNDTSTTPTVIENLILAILITSQTPPLP